MNRSPLNMSRDETLTTIRSYFELIRFSHTIFALPFAILVSMWAWILSERQKQPVAFSWWSAIGIIVCMIAARSFAMSINRLADAKLDGLNPRTSNRHLPAGTLSYSGVIGFAILCGLVFIFGTLLFLPNRLPIWLSLPVLSFLASYSFAKRFTVWVHFWLGMALGLAPLCAWIALRGDIVIREPTDLLPALLVGMGVMLWVTGFDLIYACQDAEIDRQLGLKSIPSWLGVANALRVAAACHAIMLVPLAILPVACPVLGLGSVFWGGLALVAMLLLFEHSLVNSRNLAKVNVAFFQANAIISVVILLFGIVDAWDK